MSPVPPDEMADYGWGLSDETEKKARRQLNEVPERRKASIDAVREQMCTRPDISKPSSHILHVLQVSPLRDKVLKLKKTTKKSKPLTCN